MRGPFAEGVRQDLRHECGRWTRPSVCPTAASLLFSFLMSQLSPRSNFLQEMLDLLPADAVHFGHRCTRYTHSDDGVTLHFANGSSAFANVVVGADGIKSVLRENLYAQSQLEQVAQAPKYSGWVVWRGLIERGRFEEKMGKDYPTKMMRLGQRQHIIVCLPSYHSIDLLPMPLLHSNTLFKKGSTSTSSPSSSTPAWPASMLSHGQSLERPKTYSGTLPTLTTIARRFSKYVFQ